MSALINTHACTYTHTHGQDDCVFSGLGAGSDDFPRERWTVSRGGADCCSTTGRPAWHHCTRNAQLPPRPPLGSAAKPVDVWLRCVWSKIRPSTASAPPQNLLDSWPPAAAPLTTSSLPGALRVNGTVEQREALRSTWQWLQNKVHDELLDHGKFEWLPMSQISYWQEKRIEWLNFFYLYWVFAQ